MNFKKIISLALVLIGALMIGGSLYIKNEVAKGRIELLDAEKTLDAGKALFSLTPVTKALGHKLTESADRKVDDAHIEVAYYANLAENLMIGGVISIAFGLLLFVFYARRT